MRRSLLDHGYIELVETWGSDERIVEAARMSTGKGFLGWDEHYECPDHPPSVGCHQEGTLCGKWRKIPGGDERLLKRLYDLKHATPFEMAGAIFEIKAPLMVFREWQRHRTQSYNEMSARYTPLPDEDYVPSVERLMLNATVGAGQGNKQAGTIAGAKELTRDNAAFWVLQLQAAYDHVQRVYEEGLMFGVPKELARLPVTVGRYSRMRASANLRNWIAFLTLREDKAAQYEIREYAHQVCSMLAAKFPRTMALYIGSAT
jgi:thymidylate synthase (FAD)